MFRAKRDPARRAAHSCKSSIGRMKRVIRYDHSIYNDASVFRESRFLYRLLWFRETTTLPSPPLPLRPLRLCFLILISRARDRFAAREDPRGTPMRFARKRNARNYRTFFGKGNRARVAFRKHASPTTRRVTVYIAHSIVSKVEVCKIRERQRWRQPSIRAFSASERADSLPPSRADDTREDSWSSLASIF